MLNYKSLLKSAFMGKKFIKQINLGKNVMCQAETIYPNSLESNRDQKYIELSSVSLTDICGFKFSKNGYLETNVVCEAYEFYGREGYPPHNTNLYVFYILNAATGAQIFKVTFNTGPNTSGYSDIPDRYYVTTVYDANNKKIGSFTKRGTFGELHSHYMYYDWSAKKYIFGGNGDITETGGVSFSAEFTPFKLKIVNAYSGVCPKIISFATEDYMYYRGLKVYKAYKLS